MSGFERLMRFIDEDGTTRYGNSPHPVDPDSIVGTSVDVLTGSAVDGFKETGERSKVRKLSVPKHPVLFSKPPTAPTGPYDDVHIHPEVEQKLDYEGELTVVIGKDAKNVDAANALDYMCGYTLGDDLSARDYQVSADVSGGQFHTPNFSTNLLQSANVLQPRLSSPIHTL